jgi:hypothetical protein
MPLVSLTFIQTRQDRGKVGNQPFADFGVSGQIKVVAILGVNALQLISDSLRASVQSLRQNFRLTAVLNQCFDNFPLCGSEFLPKRVEQLPSLVPLQLTLPLNSAVWVVPNQDFLNR